MRDSGAERHQALASPTRGEILRLMAEFAQPVDAGWVADAVALHVTTARFHLAQLERAGLIHREDGHPTGRGRPRVLYSLVGHSAEEKAVGELAAVLAQALTDDPDGGRARAELAGRRWAMEYSTDIGQGPEPTIDTLARIFDRLGFEPRLREDDDGWALALHGCPFRGTAAAYPQVVCSAHRGLLAGLLTQTGDASLDAELQPFTEPDVCLVHLRGSLIPH